MRRLTLAAVLLAAAGSLPAASASAGTSTAAPGADRFTRTTQGQVSTPWFPGSRRPPRPTDPQGVCFNCWPVG